MTKERRKKMIIILLALLFLLAGQEIFLFKLGAKDSLLSQLRKKWLYSSAISRGMRFYTNEKISGLEIDEYFLLKEIFSHENNVLFSNPQNKYAKDPFKRILNRNDPVLDIKFEKKYFAEDLSRSVNNSFYQLNKPYASFLIDPLDDVLFKSLYCDRSGYDDSDFLILKSINIGDGGYFDTHFLLSLLLLRENGCYSDGKIGEQIGKAVNDILNAEKNDRSFSDLYAERVVVLYWAGYGNLVKKEWIDTIKDGLTEDPGWRDKGLFVSDAHATGLALLSLIYYTEGENEQFFYR